MTRSTGITATGNTCTGLTTRTGKSYNRIRMSAVPAAAPGMIVSALRRAILTGELRSGQALPQDEIAARYGVSKIPAREALVQLKAEGLVTLLPNRGAFVSALSVDEVIEIYAMREALEMLALRRAVPNLSKADLVRAGALIELMDDERDLLAWSELNWEFHAALYQPAGMPRLIEHVRMLHTNVQRYLIHFLSSVNYHTEAQRQHRLILSLCKGGEAEQAAIVLGQHLNQAATKMSARLGADAQEGRGA
jgi:DNA-binding GntR family transcriptional regulator